MPIGKTIIIDNKTKEVIGKTNGCFMMNGKEAWIDSRTTAADLIDVPHVALENYVPHIFEGPLGTDIINMYGLEVGIMQRGADNTLYGRIDLGYFSLAVLFLRPERKGLESGGYEVPLWQERELSGHRIPLIDASGRVMLEDICFGRAEWVCREERENFEYVLRNVLHENLFSENGARDVIGISKEDFRKLVEPITAKLQEYQKDQRGCQTP